MKAYTIFEYGHITAKPATSAVQVSQKGFRYLENLALDSTNAESGFLKLTKISGQRAIQVRNYVGVLQLPTTEQLEILPKIAKLAPAYGDGFVGQSASSIAAFSESRSALLNMLRSLKYFRHIASAESSLATSKLPLLDIFISQFLASVNQLIKRGLRSEYLSREDNVLFLKGKLLPSKQLKHNLVNKQRFYVEQDEYLNDRPINRLIHTALKKVAAYTHVNSQQKLCRELSFAFSDVPTSKNVKQDFAVVKMTRGMEYYRQPLAWAKLILEGLSPIAMAGQAKGISLLFPMEAVFEAYVARVLAEQLPAPYRLNEQAKGETQHLVSFGDKNWFRLKPDLLIKQGKSTVLVMDTKWKLLDSQKNNGTDKLGLSQADFYQMFAYGHKYLQGAGDIVLIYPATATFSQPIESCFQFNEGAGGSNLRLWVVPFDVATPTPNVARMMWPTALHGFSPVHGKSTLQMA
ncbi:McrC family protein [Umboniibacter marinipuniceus]|uniref:5-methylcytosine-specific restriction enzyme subunit McrC n=1 Tax=Umboniibacter marinipuniceus TaxID=569599 RepID=A0A3M0AUR6_9GAMM|nr:McrC family protein [Umboniibacter marinipuniceus]RMA82712.1 5-methylcytosine-specific restriction enzyme subunit McrC [Umboniibacter marinipuniceus]